MAGFGDMSRMKEAVASFVKKLGSNRSSKDSNTELDQQHDTADAVISTTPLWRKKSIIIGGAILAVSAAVIIGVQQYQQYIKSNTFEIVHVYQDGTYIGSVEKVEDVQQLIEEEELELANNNPGISMELKTGELTYESEVGYKIAADTETTLSKLEQSFASHAVGVAIVVDGKTLGYVKDEIAASNILNRLQTQYAPQVATAEDARQIQSLSYNANEEEADSAQQQAATNEDEAVTIKDVGFVEKVDITLDQVEPTVILEEEELYKKIIDGSTKPTKYVVQKGDCIGCIAHKFGISEQVIYENNPFIEGDRITAGDELDLTVRMPDITVRSVEQLVEIEEIAPPIEYVKNDSMREGESKTIQEGAPGSQRLIYEITKENGYILSEELVEKEVIEEAVPTIIEKGTMIIAGTGTGSFAYPVSNYRVSSKYGKRWGRMHSGVDFTGDKTIKASDAGVVEFVGTKNGYGKTVIIDHKNGYKTLYGHLNSYSVSEGDKVAKGDKVGVMGNTGRSTGVHLHFEIWKNGNTVNPLSYL
ncbi:peptidoglycan DD-metalloendopeptidase family protein [Paenibacillus septentrionalis]|uniref:Peptidoglycan DD-metalloendopeptidase family protein n=1 Tax=Paenibacillus septentrionalis TaxID=429342 RepID=A0ABW1V8I1_9BACL